MKKIFRAFFFYLVFAEVILIDSCSYDRIQLPVTESGYPESVGKIIVTKCATTGCHDDISKDAAGGLSLISWNKMFEGGRGGAVVIPFRPDFSTILYYTNTDTLQGIALIPTMPFNRAPLSSEEYLILKNWIEQGAPDKNGFIKFSDNPQRKKFYVGNEGCDEVAVFDAKSKLAMRYIGVGSSHAIESPHVIKVAPNNQFWCLAYLGTAFFQKFSTSDNQFLGQVNISIGSWKSFSFSSDSKKAYVTDWSGGRIATVNLDSMTVQLWSGFTSPVASALNPTDDTLYVSPDSGNFIYKIPVNDMSNFSQVSMDGLPVTNNSSLDIHQILFSPDNSKYFITCESSNEVRVINRSNDSLLAVIPVGTFPQEMDFSVSFPYLFVSCTEDVNTFPGFRGSVFIINYQNYSVIGSVYTGHQPQGVAVDDENMRVYISNRNISVDGPAPHHAAQCTGKNGYISAIDMNTLQLIADFRTEVSVDPYCVGISH